MHYGKQRKCVPIFGPCGVYHLTFSILQAGIQNKQDRTIKNGKESRECHTKVQSADEKTYESNQVIYTSYREKYIFIIAVNMSLHRVNHV